MKKVSIIIPCYNAKDYIKDCFASLEKQTIGIESLEIIFVDDASTDCTGELIEEYRKKYPKSVKTIHLSENCRQGGARNAGIVQAQGEYLSFLDADDWMDVTAYEVLYRYAVEQKLDILQFDRINIEGEKQWKENCCVLEGVLPLTDVETRKLFLMSGMFSFGCTNKLYRKEFVDRVGSSFAEKVIFEEPLFVYPLFFYAKRIGSIKKHFYFCRHHVNSTMRKDALEPKRIKNHPKVQQLVWEFMKKRPEIVTLYGAEIEYYFLSTYYAETICMAGNAGGIEAGYFKIMQDYVIDEFPKWKENPYFTEEEGNLTFDIMKSVDVDFTQETLNDYCRKVAEKVRKEEKG